MLSLRGEGVAVSTSATTGQGIEELEDKIAEIAGAADMGGEAAVVSSARHEEALRSASESLHHSLETLAQGQPIDMLSIDLTAARNALGLITGETASEDLLDRIFGEFCIGK
jgi:tRNA modification GTPase